MTAGMESQPPPAEDRPSPAPRPAAAPDDLVTVLASQPRSTRRVIDAIRDRPLLFAAPVVACLLLGLVAGLVRAPVHTAESRLAIARISVSTQALPGFAAGVQDLAVTYSRLATADEVTAEAAELLRVDPADLEGRVTSSPIPQSPLFRIEATGGTADEAIATANAAGEALSGYVSRLNSQNPDSERIYAEFLLASRDLVDARTRLRVAEERARRSRTPEAARRVVSARAQVAGAALRADSLRDQYRTSIAGTGSGNVIQVVNPARTATSDRADTLRRYAVTGLLLGLVAGTLLVLLWPAGGEQAYRPLHARS
jgi:uncharacterized protein involved in exopolysaccharide biosynthesis